MFKRASANFAEFHWFRESSDHLGCGIAKQGVTAQLRKVQANANIQPLKTKKQMKRKDSQNRSVEKNKSHWLHPRNHSNGLLKGKQAAFEERLTFPNFNEEFHVSTDASDCQSGTMIMQKGRPLAFQGAMASLVHNW